MNGIDRLSELVCERTLSSDTAEANDREFRGACLMSRDAARVAAGRIIAGSLNVDVASDGYKKVEDGHSTSVFRFRPPPSAFRC
jgi:hypothetical protein